MAPSGPTLLSRDDLIKTNELDQADWNFQPVLGYIQRQRFALATALLGGETFPRLLEIGYGSGIFLAELSRHCKELHGIDPHQLSSEVEKVLARRGIHATLASGSAGHMPYTDEFFDCVVAVSAIEFVPDLHQACAEIRRVLKPGGSFVVVTPGISPLLDFGLRALTGRSADADYGDRRQQVLPTLTGAFRVQRHRNFPRFGRPRLYTALRLTR